MDLTSKIGIAVSGCKNGYALLATDGIDSSSELLRAALRDQRNFLRVTEPGHNYFIACVYKGTLVISACRSSVDAVGSSGGFIAVSLTVPASLAINRPADLLTALLDEYWGEFMHPMFGSPLPGKLESAHRLRALLQSRAADVAPAKVRYRVTGSKAAMPPLFMEFNTVDDVNAVMSNPWHAAYMQGCELIMVPAGMLSSPKVNYNIEVKKIAPQHGVPANAIGLLYPPENCPVSVSSYAVNSLPCRSLGDVSLNPDDIISLALALPGGKTIQFNGSVREAESRKVIIRKGDSYIINTPSMDITLSITGARPVLGSEYALKSATGDVVMAKIADASNPLLREFHIRCTGFPYSLVEAQGGRVRRVMCRDAVTVEALANQPVPVNAEAAKSEPMPFGGKGEPTGPHGRKPKRRLPMPIMVAIATLVVGLLCLGTYLLWPKESAKTSGDGDGGGGAMLSDITPDPTPDPSPQQPPKYTYLFIPVETIREAKSAGRYDHLSSQAFPPGTDYAYDKGTRLTIIRIPEVKGQSINSDLGIYLEGATEEKCGLLELNNTSMPEYDEFVNYLNSEQDRFLVRPADPDKQPKTELLESINTMNLDSLEYKPLDTTPPTEVESTTPTTQKPTPAQQKKPANPKTKPKTKPQPGSKPSGESKL